MASALGLLLSIVVLLVLVIHLDGVRTTLLSVVPSAHTDIANWLVILVGLVGGISLTVGVAVVGLSFYRSR